MAHTALNCCRGAATGPAEAIKLRRSVTVCKCQVWTALLLLSLSDARKLSLHRYARLIQASSVIGYL